MYSAAAGGNALPTIAGGNASPAIAGGNANAVDEDSDATLLSDEDESTRIQFTGTQPDSAATTMEGQHNLSRTWVPLPHIAQT